jgi:hypothetical protein
VIPSEVSINRNTADLVPRRVSEQIAAIIHRASRTRPGCTQDSFIRYPLPHLFGALPRTRPFRQFSLSGEVTRNRSSRIISLSQKLWFNLSTYVLRSPTPGTESTACWGRSR